MGGSSWELVRAAQGGDREAFGRLYQRYAGPVSALVMARTGDRILAQDLTSETFTRGWWRIESLQDQGRDPGAWFATIARNLVADHWKSSRTRLDTPTPEFPDPGRGVPLGQRPSPTPEQVLIDRETAGRLWRQVARLPADQRDCVRLRFAQGLSVAQAAQVLNRSDGAVKALQHRAITALRAALTAQDQAAARHVVVGDPLVRARVAVTAAAARAAGAGQHRAAAERTRSRQWADIHHHTRAQDQAVEISSGDAVGGRLLAEGVA